MNAHSVVGNESNFLCPCWRQSSHVSAHVTADIKDHTDYTACNSRESQPGRSWCSTGCQHKGNKPTPHEFEKTSTPFTRWHGTHPVKALSASLRC